MVNQKPDKHMNFRSSGYIIFILITLLIGPILRLHNLGVKSLWDDEIYSVDYSSNTLEYILLVNPIGDPVQPPLYFVLLHFWMFYAGKTEFMLRLLSVVFGILSIIMLYILGKYIFDTKTGVISALLLSLSYLHVVQSQTVRMYTLLTFLVIISLYSLYKALKEGGSSIWIAYVISTTLSIYTHYFALFIFLSESVYMIYYTIKNKKPKKNLLIPLIVIALYIPWILNFYRNMNVILESRLANTLERELWGVNPKTALYTVNSALSSTKYLLPLYIALILFGLKSSYNVRKQEYNFILTCFILPFILIVLVSTRVTIGVKYFVVILPPYILLAAKGLSDIRDKNIMLVVLSVIVIASIGKLYPYYESETAEWRQAAQYIRYATAGEKTILVLPPSGKLSLTYYYYDKTSESNLPLVGVTEYTGKPEKTIDLIGKHTKAWIVYTEENRIYDERNEIIDWLEENCKSKKKELTWIKVYSCTSP